ncbi:cytochrome P450 [Actinocorallia sp. A-T 12471]|uniref:cytochrome P450 n=1 Tax=Actinocorallia sp. A-T 12471 TaxID=3089813 RepID=UPI0029D311F9|nr:cytochrome P450 [Actinocorallia sp. A-T 12471]MDX6740728.1 cytochrome P450 [Actinocorallia sp. A-T 12471]
MTETGSLTCPYNGTPRYPFDGGEPTQYLNEVYFELGPGVWPIWLELAQRPAFLVNGHALLVEVFTRADDFLQPVDPIPGVVPLQGTLLAMHGREHLRVRRPAARPFGRAEVERRRGRVRDLVEARLDGFAGRESFDLVADLATPLTLQVLGEILGVPEADLPLFVGWGDRFLNFSDPLDARAAVQEMCAHIGGLLQARKADPSSDDILSAYAGEQGKDVSTPEAVMVGANIVSGGWETTTTALTSMVLHLLTHGPVPGGTHWDALVADPSLIPGAVQELLRTRPASGDDGPPRIAARDLVLDGVEIPAGSILILGKYGASSDPGVFPEPRTVDFTRENARDHLAFGAGPHICLGKWLAIVILEEALAALLARYPGLRLTGEPIEWRKRSGARRPEQLWLHPA